MATAAKYKVYNGTSWVEYVFPVASHSHTITANATDGIFDITGTNGTNAVTYALAPYSSQQSKLSFDTSSTAPTRTDRLNLNGYFYATKLYSGGSEVLTLSGGTLSGNLILNNTIAIQSKNTGGTALNILYTNSSNNIILGNTSLSGIYTYNGIYPGATNSYNLGTSSLKWKNLYLSGYIGNDNASYGLALPTMTSWTANKTIATTDQIPSLTNYITLDGAQTITGAKTFSAGTEFTGSGEMGAGTKTTIYSDGIQNTQNSTTYNYYFPAKSGTFALTSELPIIKQMGMGPITANGTSCTLNFTVYSYDPVKYSVTTASDFSSKIVNGLLANAVIDSSHTISGTVNISGTSYTISSYNKSTKTLTLSNNSTLNLSTITSAYFYTYPYMADLGCDTNNLRTTSTTGYYFTAGTNGSVGAKGLYEHNVRIYYSSSNFSVTFKFVDNYSSAYTYTTISYYLYNRGFTGPTTVCPANGVYGTSTGLNLITGVFGYSSSSYYYLYFRYIPLVSYSSSTATINNTVSGESPTSITLTSSFTVQDKVRQL